MGDPCLVLLNPGVIVELLHGELVDPLLGIGNVIAAVARSGEDTPLDGLELVGQTRDRGTGAGGVLGSNLSHEPSQIELALAAQAAARAGLFFTLLAHPLAERRIRSLRLGSRLLLLVRDPPDH